MKERRNGRRGNVLKLVQVERRVGGVWECRWAGRGAEMNADGNWRGFWELIYPFSEYKSVIYPLYALDLYPRE